MNHVRGVQRFECAKGLIDEVLSVVIREVLRSDHTMHIRLHELLDHWKMQAKADDQRRGHGEGDGTHGRPL